jgi:alginate O-acetyltransferase complex protein AlgI
VVFNSLTYLLFLTLVVVIFWVLPRLWRPAFLFLASLIFYSFWNIYFLPLLVFSVFWSWWLAIKIYSSSRSNRKSLLIISLAVSVGLLIYFKYLIFFQDTFLGFANLLNIPLERAPLEIILPLGISFYTFQNISYTFDVYRGHVHPEKQFLIYASYVTFFPQLVAGPILRVNEFVPQIKTKLDFSVEGSFAGVRRIFYGLFLKVVLADNLAPLVDQGFGMPVNYLSALDIWTLAFLFGFQIYFDFSAYSHIALGCALLVGIKFPENFNFPYFSSSPREFWRRWHITLSAWIKDYLYLPLQKAWGEKASTSDLTTVNVSLASAGALVVTWFIMGLWHGANWTFVLWGFYHALLIIIYRIFSKKKIVGRWTSLGSMMVTMPLIMLGWIPFRAESVEIALSMWAKVFDISAYTWLGMRENSYLIAFCVFAASATVYAATLIRSPKNSIERVGLLILDALKVAVVVTFTLIYFQSINQFIYFQF